MDQDACNYRTFNHIKCVTHNPLQKLKAPRCCTWEFGGRVDYKTSERRLKKEQSGICKTTGCGRRQREPSPSCAARSPTSERDLRPCGRSSSRFPVPALRWPAARRCAEAVLKLRWSWGWAVQDAAPDPAGWPASRTPSLSPPVLPLQSRNPPITWSFPCFPFLSYGLVWFCFVLRRMNVMTRNSFGFERILR